MLEKFPVTPLLIILGSIAFLVVASRLASRADKKHIADVQAALELEGFVFGSGKAAYEGAVAAMGRVGPYRALQNGSKGVVWHAFREVHDHRCTMLEHCYISNYAGTAMVRCHTIAAVDAPTAWPALQVMNTTFFNKIGRKFGVRDIKLEDAEFNKRFRVKCVDENFALLALTPEIQAWFKASKNVEFSIGDGAVCVVKLGICKGKSASRLSAGVGVLRSMIPHELDSYNSLDAASIRDTGDRAASSDEGMDERESDEPVGEQPSGDRAEDDRRGAR